MDSRKTDDGSAGPRPHGLRQGELIEELESRNKFLRANSFRDDVEAKVVKAPEQAKPKHSKVAETK